MEQPAVMSQATLTEDERNILRTKFSERGMVKTARALGISRESLARAIAGLGIRAGTVSLIREALKQLTVALVLLTFSCSAPPRGVDSVAPVDSAEAGSPGETQPQGRPEGAAGAPDVVVDQLMAPCGPAHCGVAPTLDLAASGRYGCYQGVCTFRCEPNVDAAAAYCATLGGSCQGDATGVVSCQ